MLRIAEDDFWKEMLSPEVSPELSTAGNGRQGDDGGADRPVMIWI